MGRGHVHCDPEVGQIAWLREGTGKTAFANDHDAKAKHPLAGYFDFVGTLFIGVRNPSRSRLYRDRLSPTIELRRRRLARPIRCRNPTQNVWNWSYAGVRHRATRQRVEAVAKRGLWREPPKPRLSLLGQCHSCFAKSIANSLGTCTVWWQPVASLRDSKRSRSSSRGRPRRGAPSPRKSPVGDWWAESLSLPRWELPQANLPNVPRENGSVGPFGNAEGAPVCGGRRLASGGRNSRF